MTYIYEIFEWIIYYWKMTRHSEKEKLHISHLLTYVYTMLLLLSILGLRIATYTKIKIIMHVKKNLAEERRE